MLRRLIMMRHAKSSQTNVTTDHDRPLDPKGQEQAPKTAKQLKQLRWIPDLVLSSDAQRTSETWEFMQPVLGTVNIEFLRELYQVNVDQILNLIEKKANDSHTLMILGHNPASEALVEWLCTEIIDLGTANAALLEADVDWQDILTSKGEWNFKQIITP